MSQYKQSLAVLLVVLLASGCTADNNTATEKMSDNAGIPRMDDGTPDLNGIWQVLNEANWNLEAHNATQGPVYALGAQFSVPPGLGVVEGSRIPYLEAALAERDNNAASRLMTA